MNIRLADRLRAAIDGFAEPDALVDLLNGRQLWFRKASELEDDLGDAVRLIDRMLRRVRGSRNEAATFRNSMTRYLDDPEDSEE